MGPTNVRSTFESRNCFHRLRLRHTHPRLARHRIFAARQSDERPAIQRRGLAEANVWHLARLPRQWKIFPQWKIRIALPHEDAAKVGVASEANAHHVINLALVPIRRAPDRR